MNESSILYTFRPSGGNAKQDKVLFTQESKDVQVSEGSEKTLTILRTPASRGAQEGLSELEGAGLSLVSIPTGPPAPAVVSHGSWTSAR